MMTELEEQLRGPNISFGLCKRAADVLEAHREIKEHDEIARLKNIETGISYLTDLEGELPIKISLYSRPTKAQWRKMLDLCLEIEQSSETG